MFFVCESVFYGACRYDDELRDDPEKHLCTRRRTVIANTEGDLGFLCYDALIDVMRRQPTLVFRLRALASKRRDKEQRHQLDAGPTDAEITISEQMSLTKTPIHSGPFSAVTAGVAMMKKATSPLPRIRLEEVKNDQSSTKQADDDVVVPPSGDSSELLRSGDSTESMRSVETPSKSKSRMAMLVDDSGSGSAPRSPRRRNGRKSGRGEPGVNLKLGSWVHIKVGFGGMEKIWCALDRSSKMRSEGQLCLKFSIGLHEAPFALCPEIVLNTSSAVRESTVPDAPDSEVEVMSDRGRTRILRIGDPLPPYPVPTWTWHGNHRWARSCLPRGLGTGLLTLRHRFDRRRCGGVDKRSERCCSKPIEVSVNFMSLNFEFIRCLV